MSVHLPSLHEGSVHRDTDEERTADDAATSVQSKHILWASCSCGWRGPTHWADWEPDRFGRLAPTNSAHGKAEADALAHLARSPTPVEVTTSVYDGPGPDANLLGVFQPGEPIVVDAPQVWVQYR